MLKKIRILLYISIFIGLFYLSDNTLNSYAAQNTNTFKDAYEFYKEYGSNNIKIFNGGIYYCSCGKKAGKNNIRYAVLGQKFTLNIFKSNKQYDTAVTIDKGNNSSSKRISYIYKDEYYYSLYCIKYDVLFNKLKERYPGVDFNLLMYNRKVVMSVNFYLTIIEDNTFKGDISENKKGWINKKGLVCDSYEEINSVVLWPHQVSENLKKYYNITLDIYEPSKWIIRFHSNLDNNNNDIIYEQEFTYNKKTKLKKYNNKNNIIVKFNYNNVTLNGKKIKLEKKKLMLPFIGWSEIRNGKIIYKDNQYVKNITDVHMKIIDLYAIYGDNKIKFLNSTADKYILLGWSEEKIPVLKWNQNITDTNLKIYKIDDIINVSKDITYYAVWKKKRERIYFKTPDNNKTFIKNYNYIDTQIDFIKNIIVSNNYLGSSLNKILVKYHISNFN